MIHSFSTGFTVEVVGADTTGDYDAATYGIYLKDSAGQEIMSWTGQEWIDDPSIVAAIVNAVLLGASKGPEVFARIRHNSHTYPRTDVRGYV